RVGKVAIEPVGHPDIPVVLEGDALGDQVIQLVDQRAPLPDRGGEHEEEGKEGAGGHQEEHQVQEAPAQKPRPPAPASCRLGRHHGPHPHTSSPWISRYWMSEKSKMMKKST